MTDAHCHPMSLAERFPPAEEERRSLGIICAASSTTEAEFLCHEGLSQRARAEGAAPVLPCFAVHPQMPRPGDAPGRFTFFLELLENLAAGGRIPALGEAGFDLYGPEFRATEELQDLLFSAQLEIARSYGLPLVLHVRRAMHKVFARAGELKKLPAVIFHSWSGTAGEGEALLRRGLNVYFSFGTVILLNHKEARRCCARFPPERLLAETDAPYQPLRDREFSRWADLGLVLRGMAELRREGGGPGDLRAADLEKTVDGNFRRAFGLPA
ncbi:MAG: TatD family hydrolase [Treponema sp.]|jgi:TatD DNase family protein|nr:TatD family hydrolase [Treponema sp.]